MAEVPLLSLLALLLLRRFVLRALLLSGWPLPGANLSSEARLLDQNELAEGPMVAMWG